ncbi:retrovirus-related pol polyprotein from transposon TNT 1-94 [Tanacetum coccineum]
METYMNVSKYIWKQLDAEVEVVQIIHTGIDNDIYSTVDACLNAFDRSDDANDEPEDRELEAHYLYMAKIQEVTPDVADNSGPVFDAEPLQNLVEIILFIFDSRNRGKVIVKSPLPIYDQEPTMVAEEDDEMSNEMRLDNSPKTNRGIEYNNQRASNITGVRETVVDRSDDANDEPEDRELEAHYLYMAKIQEVTLDVADNSGPVFDAEPLQNLVEIILFIFDSGCSKHMTRNLKILSNFVNKFLGSHGTYLYSITLQDTSTPNLIFLMAKASSSQAWLWQRRLSHLKFDTINFLSKYDIVNGLPKLKFIKDHLCSFCELRKAKQIGSQSIECDHLNEIGMVVRLVEFISFTFGDKEMIL